MRKVLAMLIILVWPMSAWAGVTYYVSNANPVGSDSNSGTSPSTPWLTINKVNTSTFNPGDSILFNCGCTWREQLTVPSSGSSGNPITFGAYGTGTSPVITCFDIIATAEWGTPSGGVYSALPGWGVIINMMLNNGTLVPFGTIPAYRIISFTILRASCGTPLQPAKAFLNTPLKLPTAIGQFMCMGKVI